MSSSIAPIVAVRTLTFLCLTRYFMFSLTPQVPMFDVNAKKIVALSFCMFFIISIAVAKLVA